MKTIKIVAPAKVNLFLEVGALRADGYHDAATVMHALALHDTLSMTWVREGERVRLAEPGDAAQPVRHHIVSVEPGDGLSVQVKVVWAEGIEPVYIPVEDNLAVKAVKLLASLAGRTEDECIRMVIEKHIPSQMGLGGGSSDAAAALVGAASLWGFSIDDAAVQEAAQQLGSDVLFFLRGGCALLEGRGESFVRSLFPRRDALVVVRPGKGVSTVDAYEAFDRMPAAAVNDTARCACTVDDACSVPLANNLSAAAESLVPDIKEVRAIIESSTGVKGALLCGSGSGVFGVCESYAAAQAAAAAAQAKGYWARATSFSSLRAAQLPS